MNGPQGRQLVGGFDMIRAKVLLVQSDGFFEHGDSFVDAPGMVARHAQTMDSARHPQWVGTRQGCFNLQSVARNFFDRREVALIAEDVGQRIQTLQVRHAIVGARRDFNGCAHRLLRLVQVRLFTLSLRQQQPHLNSLGSRVAALFRVHRRSLQIYLRLGIVASFE